MARNISVRYLLTAALLAIVALLGTFTSLILNALQLADANTPHSRSCEQEEPPIGPGVLLQPRVSVGLPPPAREHTPLRFLASGNSMALPAFEGAASDGGKDVPAPRSAR